jgi:formylglycine-generating enzyme required for sulfatase activity
MSNFLLPSSYTLHHRYQITRTIGQGGFGITYEAYDETLDTKVCIKELFVSGQNTRGANNSVLSQDVKDFSFEDFVGRFIAEARQLARFSQPNIVSVRDIFPANGTAYMVMEYIEGQTLKQYVAGKGSLTTEQALPVFNQLLDAVETVHNAGMLHRDIKPDNIMIGAKNRLVLIDFGSARSFIEGKTSTHSTILTPGYAPIEQYGSKKQRGAYTDIYSLGATLYFMLTGSKPMDATDRYSEEMPAPHKLNPKISEQLGSAVMLAMEMKTEDRFQSVIDFRNGINLFEHREGSKNKPTSKNEEKTKIKNQNHPSTYTNEYGMEFILVEAGTFMMGANHDDTEAKDDEKPAHQVTLTESYYIGKYPITQAQWEKIMESNPSHFVGFNNCPVENVNWYDVQEFVRKINSKTGKMYRLPTEAEWEYVARGGKKSKGFKYSGGYDLNKVGWFYYNSFTKTQPVGSKQANELGIFDMSGNVWEWCEDWYGNYTPQSNTNPKGTISGNSRVLRGGSWNFSPQFCRVTDRRNCAPDLKLFNHGFRLVLVS